MKDVEPEVHALLQEARRDDCSHPMAERLRIIASHLEAGALVSTGFEITDGFGSCTISFSFERRIAKSRQ